MALKKTSRRRERRQELRVDARLSMRVEGAHDGAHAQVVTESMNISASGVYCLSSHFLPPLSKVQLTIVLPKIPGTSRPQELVKCDGIVVRCEAATGRRQEPRYQLACMFARLDAPLRERIEEFVTWRNLQALRAAVGAPRAGSPRAVRKKTARKGSAPARRKVSVKLGARGTGVRRSAR
jgi:c-di-GMP-binding flagellar brake protein YcgR